jgi:hypothetical protein
VNSYAVAKILHFIGLIALFGYFLIDSRAAARMRAATQLTDIREWLGVRRDARRMLHAGAAMILISGMWLVSLRFRGRYPFTAIGLLTLLSIWLLSAVGGRHLRAIREMTPAGNGSLPDTLIGLIRAPAPWLITGAMQGAAAGILLIMTLKPDWFGSAGTVLLTSAVGACWRLASLRRSRASASTASRSALDHAHG